MYRHDRMVLVLAVLATVFQVAGFWLISDPRLARLAILAAVLAVIAMLPIVAHAERAASRSRFPR